MNTPKFGKLCVDHPEIDGFSLPELLGIASGLTRQRDMLGNEKFQGIVEKEVGQEQAENVYKILEKCTERQESDDEA
jgi:hypothetical protein